MTSNNTISYFLNNTKYQKLIQDVISLLRGTYHIEDNQTFQIAENSTMYLGKRYTIRVSEGVYNKIIQPLNFFIKNNKIYIEDATYLIDNAVTKVTMLLENENDIKKDNIGFFNPYAYNSNISSYFKVMNKIAPDYFWLYQGILDNKYKIVNIEERVVEVADPNVTMENKAITALLDAGIEINKDFYLYDKVNGEIILNLVAGGKNGSYQLQKMKFRIKTVNGTNILTPHRSVKFINNVGTTSIYNNIMQFATTDDIETCEYTITSAIDRKLFLPIKEIEYNDYMGRINFIEQSAVDMLIKQGASINSVFGLVDLVGRDVGIMNDITLRAIEAEYADQRTYSILRPLKLVLRYKGFDLKPLTLMNDIELTVKKGNLVPDKTNSTPTTPRTNIVNDKNTISYIYDDNKYVLDLYFNVAINEFIRYCTLNNNHNYHTFVNGVKTRIIKEISENILAGKYFLKQN